MQRNVSKNNVQYPPQTGPYKVTVKDKSIWRGHNAVRLQISVGNPKHEGTKFFALTEWAASRFDKVILIVSDTLQRHNIATEHGVSLEEAYKISVLAGQKWLRENKTAIDNFAPGQCIITFWDEWMTHAHYAETLEEIVSLYHSSTTVRETIDAKANEFCLRQDADLSVDQKSLESSVTYILEEVAAFAIMFKETQAVDVYPGPWFKEIFEAIGQTEGITPLLTSLYDAVCLRVDFTRNHFRLQHQIRQACKLARESCLLLDNNVQAKA